MARRVEFENSTRARSLCHSKRTFKNARKSVCRVWRYKDNLKCGNVRWFWGGQVGRGAGTFSRDGRIYVRVNIFPTRRLDSSESHEPQIDPLIVCYLPKRWKNSPGRKNLSMTRNEIFCVPRKLQHQNVRMKRPLLVTTLVVFLSWKCCFSLWSMRRPKFSPSYKIASNFHNVPANAPGLCAHKAREAFIHFVFFFAMRGNSDSSWMHLSSVFIAPDAARGDFSKTFLSLVSVTSFTIRKEDFCLVIKDARCNGKKIEAQAHVFPIAQSCSASFCFTASNFFQQSNGLRKNVFLRWWWIEFKSFYKIKVIIYLYFRKKIGIMKKKINHLFFASCLKFFWIYSYLKSFWNLKKTE